MLQLRNTTPFAGTIMMLPDPDGIDCLYTVIKATFTIGRTVTLAETQVPVAMGALHHGDPGTSSIRVPSDVSLMKPGTDVLLVGHAYAPGGRSATEMDVTLRVGPVSKRVRVFGDRVWRLGYTVSRPKPFDTMPLMWELAYGGVDETRTPMRGEDRNPVGLGFQASNAGDGGGEFPLPNLEDPSHPISGLRSSPPPACFAPIAPHWEPRRSYAGTYDEYWQRERAPYLPEDFDPRFLQNAPADQVVPGHLHGGETVEVQGASRSGVLRFQLPNADIGVTCVLDSGRHAAPVTLDTVLIEPDQDRVQVVWRSALPCDKSLLRVREVIASLGDFDVA